MRSDTSQSSTTSRPGNTLLRSTDADVVTHFQRIATGVASIGSRNEIGAPKSACPITAAEFHTLPREGPK
jgi:hypothetical protein